MVTKVLCLTLALFCAVSAASENRLVGGSPAAITEFPSVVALVYHYPRPNIFIQRCVGSLISSWHVLTSAYCFTGSILTNFHIRAGSAQSLSGGQMRSVRQMIKHPEYDEETRNADIAVVILNQALGISQTVGVLYLPPANTILPVGLQARVASWGFETEDGPQHASLKSITLTTQNLELCKEAYEDDGEIKINEDQICALSESAGTCFGDSGAPMITYNNVLIGLSSYYKECGDSSYPDVFTRVAAHTDWIMEVAVAPTGERPLSRTVV
ncbi:trypsin 3A1-like [Maniola jurtina]|uniref:trypsin 3A1-like n=1 Tax=Maniola jurtina TaxID=191418 RepID=UPI001E686E44|nr:trypsin 3A1-like [Maniola jurtina]